jgi:gluconolactonase
MRRMLLCLPLIFLAAPAAAETALVAKGAEWEKVPVTLQFGEGPAWNPAGYLLFEDTRGNKTMKLDKEGTVSVYRAPSGRSNGQVFDPQGRLVVAEGADGDGGRRIARTEKDGKVVTVVDRFEGKRFNSPNDLTVDGHGRLYFTDPRYSANRSDLELDKEAVYRVDPDGKLTRIIESLTRPNGIAVTRDGKTLYIADNASPGGVVKLMAFDLDAHGAASNGRAIYDFVTGRGIDGMTLDAGGRIWATAGTADKAGVYVFQPDARRTTAKLVKVINIGEEPTNCTFGGKDRSVLYVTTRTGLYKLQTAVKGQPSPPGK